MVFVTSPAKMKLPGVKQLIQTVIRNGQKKTAKNIASYVETQNPPLYHLSHINLYHISFRYLVLCQLLLRCPFYLFIEMFF